MRASEAVSERSVGAPLDLLAVGQLFLDVLYGPLPAAPQLGSEVFADGVSLVPGGIANFALAATALGARTGIAARTGEGPASQLVAATLERSGVDVSRLAVEPGWDLQVTSGIAYDGDRVLVTGGRPPAVPIDADLDPAGARAIAVHLAPGEMPWLAAAAQQGAQVFADVGWDPTGAWDTAILRHLEHCRAFLPNADEATAYTRTGTPRAAARALAEHVPLVVVTCGAAGVIAIDAATGAEHEVPALDLGPVDPTGAGDTFGAALIALLGQGLDLRDALEAAVLAATARAAAVVGPARTPTRAQLADLARTHHLACADAVGASDSPTTPTGSSKEQS